MADRIVETEQAREMLIRFVRAHKLPFTASITAGKHRTTRQNKLQRQWMKEIAEQLEDRTAEEARGYCKLHFGVPILREENEAFRQRYDRIVRPLSYEDKLTIMMEPLDLPATRIMTSKQKTTYLDTVHKHFTEQGIVLTDPGDLLRQSYESEAA
jgi:hypothetical protein